MQKTIEDIVKSVSIPVQLGGGIRTLDNIKRCVGFGGLSCYYWNKGCHKSRLYQRGNQSIWCKTYRYWH